MRDVAAPRPGYCPRAAPQYGLILPSIMPQFVMDMCRPANIGENIRHGLAVKARPHGIWAASERIAMAATRRMSNTGARRRVHAPRLPGKKGVNVRRRTGSRHIVQMTIRDNRSACGASRGMRGMPVAGSGMQIDPIFLGRHNAGLMCEKYWILLRSTTGLPGKRRSVWRLGGGLAPFC